MGLTWLWLAALAFAAAECDLECRRHMAAALCLELNTLLDDAERADEQGGRRPAAALMHAAAFHPMLRPRTSTLRRELGCSMEPLQAPPLQPKGVENGKSAMSFLVPGGPGVDPHQPGSYSVIIKQLNRHEVHMLPGLLGELVPRYLEPEGSMLARFVAWVRYPIEGAAKPFDAIVMENVARPPPGGAGPAWKAFDMKGIRAYPHEQRFAREFGARGLTLSAAHVAAHGAALRRDLQWLTGKELVDYSFLVNVFPSGAPPRPCEQLQHAADFAVTADPVPASRLLPAFFALKRGGVDGGGADGGGAVSGAEAGGGPREGEMCASAVVRIALIDYLRDWKLEEQMEHLRKSVTRDLVRAQAPGSNHAVVPVVAFAERLAAFFDHGLFHPAPRPQQPTLAAVARELHCSASVSASALARRLRGVPTHLQKAGLAFGLRPGQLPWLPSRGAKAATMATE